MHQKDVKAVCLMHCDECKFRRKSPIHDGHASLLDKDGIKTWSSTCEKCQDWLLECDDAPFDEKRINRRIETWRLVG